MSLAATVLQNVRHSRREQGINVDGHELRSRAGNVGFTRLFQADTMNLLSPSMVSQIANLSDERTHQIVVMDKGTVNKVVNRSCTITPNQNTSALLAVNFTTLVYDFDMLPQQLYNGGRGNNEIDYSIDFANKIRQIEDDALASIEASCIASVLAYQTVATAYNAATPYAISVADAMEVPLAEQFDFLNQIDSIVALHKFGRGALNIVGSTMYGAEVDRYAENGSLKQVGSAITDSDEAWQLRNKTFRYSDYLTLGAGEKHRVFAAVPGSFGLTFNNPAVFQEGTVTSDGTIFEETGMLPLSGISMGHQRNTLCKDGREVQEFHQMSVNYATNTAYNSDPVNEPSGLFQASYLTV